MDVVRKAELQAPVDKSMVAVCGKCNIAIKLHPVPSCPYTYKPIILNGRRYGWHMRKGD